MRHFRLSHIVSILFLWTLLSFPLHSKSQDSSHLRISLLTCSPGDELYAIFGHSAFRVVDSISLTDYVYNYGTFNFDDEGFYIKFARGKLLYYISLEYFSDFVYAYRATGRTITEQVLDLDAAEKIALRSYLNENLKEENRYYKYDFFFDNCTTRLRDLLLSFKKPTPDFPAVMPEQTRFRQAIHQYLDKGKQYWSKLGIDILLGAPTDAVMTAAEQQFLPDNLMASLDNVANSQLVAQKINLYNIDADQTGSVFFTPVVFFITLLVLYLLMGFSTSAFMVNLVQRLDGMLFFLTGLLGIILLFMWFGTDHSMTKNNYNLLWAWPTHIFMAFFVNSKNPICKKYYLFTAIALSVVLISWAFLPQQMNNALIAFVLLLIYRSAMSYVK